MAHRRWPGFSTTALLAVVLLAAAASGQEEPPPVEPATLRPPSNAVGEDHPLDGGEDIVLYWDLSPDDRQLSEEEISAKVPRPVQFYKVLRASEANGVYRLLGTAQPTKWDYNERKMKFVAEKCVPGEDYWFKIAAVGQGGVESDLVGPVGPIVAKTQWFDGHPLLTGGRFWLLVITVLLCGAVIYWIIHAKRGRPLKVRKIAGLEAVDEAVGRATEMGRSCLFVPGIQDMNDIQTIAGITILARVSRTAAEYDAKVEVPTSRALVMTTARETVHAAYLAAGRPDAFNEDLIYYVTDEQFGYVAYLQGMMVREKPAACFYMGSFFAESLILAETGNSIGAIQVAGTAQPAQLPFFVAACDYTLIGEEFFAASAYLSGSPEEIGSLKGQDVGKVFVAFGLVVGIFFATFAAMTGDDTLELITNFIRDVVMT